MASCTASLVYHAKDLQFLQNAAADRVSNISCSAPVPLQVQFLLQCNICIDNASTVMSILMSQVARL